jgi:alpha-L-rhamnosidase
MAVQICGAVTVDHLRCEYLANPLGIDTPKPRLSWWLESNQRAETQTAYQILVASSLEELNQNHGDLWESGQVESSQSTLIPYAGKDLVSGQNCYWKVRVRGLDQKLSDWSAPARFSIGLLHNSDWTGSWIKDPTAQPTQQIWYRKSFTLDAACTKAFIYVASVGYHELYINGIKADDRVLAPAQSRLNKRILYVTYDVTKLLHPGDNVIALWCSPGWSRYAAFHAHPALRVQLNAITAAGKTISIASDDTWRCEVSPDTEIGNRTYTNHGGEHIDARADRSRWNEVGFDDNAWPHASADAVPALLSAQMIEPSREVETINVQSIETKGPRYLVTLTRNFSGWISIRMNGQMAGDLVTIQTSDNPNTPQAFGQKSEYVCSGVPGETFQNHFNYTAGRYVTITGLRQAPQPADIQGHVVATDFKRTGYFSCSNELFNQIYETDLRTFMANTVEGYTSDCPHRERLGYGEENFATAWGIGLPNYESGAFYANMVRNWCDVQANNGYINYTAPQNGDTAGGPMWSSAPVNIGWEMYQALGDRKILEIAYPVGKAWADLQATKVRDGLIQPFGYGVGGAFLGDWARPGLVRPPVDTPLLSVPKEIGGSRNGVSDYIHEHGDTIQAWYFNNCVYAMNLRDLIAMARLLGKEDDARLYSQRLDALNHAIHARFFNAAANTYLDGDQVQLAFALHNEIPPQNTRAAVYASFLKEIQQTHPFFDMGSSGLPILLKFLIEDADDNEIMSALLNSRAMPGYGYFLSKGETCWPEYWDGKCPSRIHTCYTGIAAWFIKSLGGIRQDPAHPGYQTFIIKPAVVGDLTYVKSGTESLYGWLESDWQRQGNTLRMQVIIPANSSATVYVPACHPDAVTESGQPIHNTPGISFLKYEKGAALYKVAAGTYDFRSTLATP